MPVARLLLAGAFALLTAGSALAQPAAAKRLPVEILPWVGDTAAPAPRDTADAVGTNFRAGTDWWALACERSCGVQPLRLAAVKPVTVSLQYSGDTPGQRLRFFPAPPRGTLLLFRPVRPVFANHPLKAGPVPSGHPVGDTPFVHPTSDTAGATEVLVDLPDGRSWLLSPTLLRPARHDGAEASNDTSGWPVSLDLRADRHHQSLGLIGSCNEIHWHDYLLWVGDLDGDGRPDFVVELDLALGGEVVLYLSSLAGRGQFVGEAGHSYSSAEGEC